MRHTKWAAVEQYRESFNLEAPDLPGMLYMRRGRPARNLIDKCQPAALLCFSILRKGRTGDRSENVRDLLLMTVEISLNGRRKSLHSSNRAKN